MYIIEKEKSYKYSMKDLKNEKEIFFENLDELLEFLRKGEHIFSIHNIFDEDSDNRNIYIKECNLTGSDRYVYKDYDRIKKEFVYKTELKRYMFFDSKGNVIDVKIFAGRVRKLYENYLKEHRFDKKPKYIFRKGPVPNTNLKKRYRGSYYRHLRTTNEKRMACDKEMKKFVRGKRSFSMIPDLYDDKVIPNYKTWKTHTKERKQWAKHFHGVGNVDKYDPYFFSDEDLDNIFDE